MKNLNAFDLLDREEGWKWRLNGGGDDTFNRQVALYLRAVKVLGRPLRRCDRHGEWRVAYWFNHRHRASFHFNLCTPERQRILRSLPYFFDDIGCIMIQKDVQQIVAFKMLHGYLPRERDPEERALRYKLMNLRLRARNGTLPAELKSQLETAEIPMDKQCRPRQETLTLIRKYVKKYKELPSSTHSDLVVRRLADSIQRVKGVKRKGKLSSCEIQEWEALPGFQWDSPIGTPSRRASTVKMLKERARQRWIRAGQDTKVFVLKHKKWPQHGASDKHERRLYKWVHDCRALKRRGILEPELEQLYEAIPGYVWVQRIVVRPKRGPK